MLEPVAEGRRIASELGVYGMIDEVFKFAATLKEFPPRSFPRVPIRPTSLKT